MGLSEPIPDKDWKIIKKHLDKPEIRKMLQTKTSEQKRTSLEAIKKLPPSKRLSEIYDKLVVTTDEWDVLFLSAQVADIIKEQGSG